MYISTATPPASGRGWETAGSWLGCILRTCGHLACTCLRERLVSACESCGGQAQQDNCKVAARETRGIPSGDTHPKRGASSLAKSHTKRPLQLGKKIPRHKKGNDESAGGLHPRKSLRDGLVGFPTVGVLGEKTLSEGGNLLKDDADAVQSLSPPDQD